MPCMPSKRAAVALFDIRDNARLAQEFAAGMSSETFIENLTIEALVSMVYPLLVRLTRIKMNLMPGV
jgi:uncharacterized protein with HEPN domain